MSDITYNYGTKRVRQVLQSFSGYDFEGELSRVVETLKKYYEDAKRYVNSEHLIHERENYRKYIDGVESKLVKFDKLFLDWHRVYDDEYNLHLVGERDMDATELAAMQAEQQKQIEQEKAQLRKLKAKYPEV